MNNDRDELVQVQLDGRLVTMTRGLALLAQKPPIRLTIDGREVEVPPVSLTDDPRGVPIARPTSIYDAAAKLGIAIPILCHREYMNPVAVCRVCCVEVWTQDAKATNPKPHVAAPSGPRVPKDHDINPQTKDDGWRRGRVTTPACYRPVEPGMEVTTHHTDDRVQGSLTTLLELLMADHPAPCEKEQWGLAQTPPRPGECELEKYAREFHVADGRVPRPAQARVQDTSSVVIAVNHAACILCDRCVRGCNDIRDNQVIGRRGKGYQAGIAFDLNAKMGDSSCVACGECMVSCPTGALTHRATVEADPWQDVVPKPGPVPADELVQHKLFAGVSHAFLRFNEGAVVRRTFKKGDLICREGDYGATAFWIESGEVEIFIESPFQHVRAAKRRGDKVGWMRRFANVLVGRDQDERAEESTDQYIHIDAPVALPYDRPVAKMGPGSLFGEMTCLSHYPRSATVRAAEDCTVLEMLRNVLYILQRNKASRALLEENYRSRAIDNHLRSVPIFASLLEKEAEFQDFVNFLRPRVELLRLNPGDVIVRQGERADAFYMIRIGFVKVSQSRPGGDSVLAYLGPGRFFGEIGLLSDLPEIVELVDRPAVRTATCTALDHVDIVRVRAEDFQAILERHPRVRQELIDTARQRLEENAESLRRVSTVPLGDFLNQGLMEAQALLVLDLERCTRCDECTKACSDSHGGVTRLIREGLRFDKYLVASSCRSCLDPYCMVGCPVGSIRRRKSQEIIIEDWCIGCGMCAQNCPYGNINMVGFPTGKTAPDPDNQKRMLPVVEQKATTCDLCMDLDGYPSCVYACPHDAAFRWSGTALLEQVTLGRAAPALPAATPVAGGKRPQG